MIDGWMNICMGELMDGWMNRRTLSSETQADPALGGLTVGVWRSYEGLRIAQSPT